MHKGKENHRMTPVPGTEPRHLVCLLCFFVADAGPRQVGFCWIFQQVWMRGFRWKSGGMVAAVMS